MKIHKRILFLLWMIIVTISLSGCLAWLGELQPPGMNVTPYLSGTVIDVTTFKIDSSDPTIELPDLSGDMKVIVAISPINGGDIRYEVTLDHTTLQQFETQKLSATSLEPSDQLSTLVNSSNDYLIYHGDAEVLKHEEVSEDLIQPQSSEKTFWVRDLSYGSDSKYYYTVTASLKRSSLVMDIYVDQNADGYTIQQIDSILNEFSNRICQKLTSFGKIYEPLSDGKVTLLVTPLHYLGSSTDIIGFFDEINLHEDEKSNLMAMTYLNSNIFAQNDMSLIYGNIAHEYQHLLFYSEKLRSGRSLYYDDLWINEGLSMLASDLTGYLDLAKDWRIFDDRLGYFAAPARDNLQKWESDKQYSNYGSTGLFAYYLYEKFGPGIISTMTKTSGTVESAISSYTGYDFEEIFQNWMTANIIDRFTNIPNSKYRYNGLSLQSAPVNKKLTLMDTPQIRERGVQYYLIEEADLDSVLHVSTYSGFSIPEINISVITFR